MEIDDIFSAELEFFSALAKAGLKPQCIADIGAARADWSKIVMRFFPDAEYHLFEPLADHVEMYDHVLTEFAEAHSNASVHRYALSRKSGKQTIRLLDREHPFAASLLDPLDWSRLARNGNWRRPAIWRELTGRAKSARNRTGHRIEIETRPLRRFVAEQGIEKFDIIKMDTQGSELEIIRGGRALFARADIVVTECYLRPGYGRMTPVITDIVNALLPLDLRLVKLGGPWFDKKGSMMTVDGFFCSRKVIDMLRASDWSVAGV